MSAYDAVAALPFVDTLRHLAVVDSTNTFARALRPPAGAGIAVVVADRQIAGRGQRGNAFFSSTEDGLWVSLIVPLGELAGHFTVNRALTLALCETVAAAGCGNAAAIKWPNDILCSSRKICGILLETHAVSPAHIVAGFGLNVNTEPRTFPDTLRPAATSLFIETGRTHALGPLLESVLTRFKRLRSLDADQAHGLYTGRLAGLGAPARIGGTAGVFAGVLPDGRAEILTPDGPNYFFSGPLRFSMEEAR